MNNKQKLFLVFSLFQLSIIFLINPSFYTGDITGSTDVSITTVSVVEKDNNLVIYLSILVLVFFLILIIIRIYFLIRRLKK